MTPNGLCFYCDAVLTDVHGDPLQRTKDHQVPASRGGKGLANNKVRCCAACNQDKGRLNVDEYRLICAYRKGVEPKDFWFPGEKADPLARVLHIESRLNRLRIQQTQLEAEMQAALREPIIHE